MQKIKKILRALFRENAKNTARTNKMTDRDQSIGLTFKVGGSKKTWAVGLSDNF